MKIIHIDDHPLFSKGLFSLLAEYFDEEVTPIQTETFESAIQALNETVETDLILLDIFMPQMNGIKMMREIRKKGFLTPIAVLSASDDVFDIKQVLDEGAMGFISKALSGQEITKAISSILMGNIFLEEKHSKALRQLPVHSKTQLIKKYALSYKQLEVLERASKGESNGEIANAMSISESAVKYHISILFQSFDVKNRIECLRYAERIGLI